MNLFEFFASNLNYLLIVILSIVVIVIASFLGKYILRLYDIKKGLMHSKEKNKKR